MNGNKNILQKLIVITTVLVMLIICNTIVSRENIDYCYLGVITFCSIKLILTSKSV